MRKLALFGASALAVALGAFTASAAPVNSPGVYGYPQLQYDFPAATGYGYPANWDYASAPPYPRYAGPEGRAAAIVRSGPYPPSGPGSMLLEQFHEGK